MKSSHPPVLALGAAFAFLALASPAQSPPKSPPPSGLTPAQAEERIKNLESRADTSEKAAASAAMEKDYITRVQKQYESYYEKVLNTQMWTLGIMGIILTAVFGLAARVGLGIFERRVQSAITEALAQLRAEMTKATQNELEILRKENTVQSKELGANLTEKIEQLEEDLTNRSDYQFQFAQGMASGADGRFGAAMASYRRALQVYKASKQRQPVATRSRTAAVRNIFVNLKKENPQTFVEKAKEELADHLYNELDDELANAALEIRWLAPLIRGRKLNSPIPPNQGKAENEPPALGHPPETTPD